MGRPSGRGRGKREGRFFTRRRLELLSDMKRSASLGLTFHAHSHLHTESWLPYPSSFQLSRRSIHSSFYVLNPHLSTSSVPHYPATIRPQSFSHVPVSISPFPYSKIPLQHLPSSRLPSSHLSRLPIPPAISGQLLLNMLGRLRSCSSYNVP